MAGESILSGRMLALDRRHHEIGGNDIQVASHGSIGITPRPTKSMGPPVTGIREERRGRAIDQPDLPFLTVR
jgi:hypothetical protein